LKTATTDKLELLQPDAIHIHVLHFTDGFLRPLTEFLLSFLSEEEKGQYQSFEIVEKRREFLLSHLLVRRLGALYLKIGMQDLGIFHGKRGKPFFQESELQFNLSHTTGLVACSFGWLPLGIDVESHQGLEAGRCLLVAKRHFSTVEQNYLHISSGQDASVDFLKIFTMKEAYVKAFGTGLTFPLADFTVPLPLQEKSHWGFWNFFTPKMQTDNFHLAHVAYNPDNMAISYKIYDWDERSFAVFLKDRDFFIQPFFEDRCA